jgi:hypothetical protein
VAYTPPPVAAREFDFIPFLYILISSDEVIPVNTTAQKAHTSGVGLSTLSLLIRVPSEPLTTA